jgi:hypothetical protein
MEVATIAPRVAIRTWPIAAPPAAGAESVAAARIEVIIASYIP